jgi:hypothetical protein
MTTAVGIKNNVIYGLWEKARIKVTTYRYKHGSASSKLDTVQGGWRPRYLRNRANYIEMSFKEIYIISEVWIQGERAGWTENFVLVYSDRVNSTQFYFISPTGKSRTSVPYNKSKGNEYLFAGNDAAGQTKKIRFEPLNVAAVHLYPWTAYRYHTVRWTLRGCSAVNNE